MEIETAFNLRFTKTFIVVNNYETRYWILD